MSDLLIVDQTPDQDEQAPKWELKKLNPNHKQAAALLAQGVDRSTIAAACDFTPEYITLLASQPLFQQYMRECSVYTQQRLEGLFEKSVDVIADNLRTGGEMGLKAAKLQLEATGRVGRFQTPATQGGTGDGLDKLAERLVELLHNQRRRTFDGEATVLSSE